MKLKRLLLALSLAALTVAVLTLFYLDRRARLVAGPSPPAIAQQEVPAYVGSDACKGCHAPEYEAWQRSHHQLAMQEATDTTVLGNFRDTRFTSFGVTSRFFKNAGKFFINTDGPDGKLRDYEIKYTFGVYPLQQYLVPFADGRLQALSIAWDARPKEQGGQAWYHLYSKEHIRASDALHWTKLQQNWNFMCAACHSTSLRKNYDEATNTYHTTWKDLSVGCEACHGAGSEHLKWAQSRGEGAVRDKDDGLSAHFDDRRDAVWVLDKVTGNSHRSRPRANLGELETCGRCHARGAEVSEDWIPARPLLDTHRVTLLDEGMYSADGQMQAEVYNYGSFVQSKMFAAGVTCSDCHEPHSQKLRSTNVEVCGLCHSPEKYASAQHHHHEVGSEESRCPACHMPVRTYMVVDRRHDHSFRIPRPDESVTYGTPNACNDCHKKESPAWAMQAVNTWYGGVHRGYQQFTAELSAARRQDSSAAAGLLRLARDGTAPAIARATAVGELRSYLDPDSVAAGREQLQSADAMIRLSAVELLAGTDPATRWQALSSALTDPIFAVRVAAADALADTVPGDIAPEESRAFQHALAEYISTQKLDADRPEAHLSLGNLYVRQRKPQDAEAEYRIALQLLPGFVPAYINLADLSRAIGQDDQAERWLAEASTLAPDSPAVVFAQALLRVRQHRTEESLRLLARATQLAPAEPHYAYAYGVGLYSTGHRSQGLLVLRRAYQRFPGNRELLLGLASLSTDSGDLRAARSYAESFVAAAPSDPRGQQILGQLPPPPRSSK